MTFEERVRAVLAEPERYPDQMRTWVTKYLSQNSNFKIQSFQLPSVQQTIGVGSDGPAFSGSWVNYNAATNAVAGFYRDPLERVLLTGLVKSGTAGTTIFSLWPNYRPQLRESFAVITDTGVGQIDIAPDGQVIHVSGGTGFVQLSGLSFRAYS